MQTAAPDTMLIYTENKTWICAWGGCAGKCLRCCWEYSPPVQRAWLWVLTDCCSQPPAAVHPRRHSGELPELGPQHPRGRPRLRPLLLLSASPAMAAAGISDVKSADRTLVSLSDSQQKNNF